jgi:hypothetical protein
MLKNVGNFPILITSIHLGNNGCESKGFYIENCTDSFYLHPNDSKTLSIFYHNSDFINSKISEKIIVETEYSSTEFSVDVFIPIHLMKFIHDNFPIFEIEDVMFYWHYVLLIAFILAGAQIVYSNIFNYIKFIKQKQKISGFIYDVAQIQKEEYNSNEEEKAKRTVKFARENNLDAIHGINDNVFETFERIGMLYNSNYLARDVKKILSTKVEDPVDRVSNQKRQIKTKRKRQDIPPQKPEPKLEPHKPPASNSQPQPVKLKPNTKITEPPIKEEKPSKPKNKPEKTPNSTLQQKEIHRKSTYQNEKEIKDMKSKSLVAVQKSEQHSKNKDPKMDSASIESSLKNKQKTTEHTNEHVETQSIDSKASQGKKKRRNRNRNKKRKASDQNKNRISDPLERLNDSEKLKDEIFESRKSENKPMNSQGSGPQKQSERSGEQKRKISGNEGNAKMNKNSECASEKIETNREEVDKVRDEEGISFNDSNISNSVKMSGTKSIDSWGDKEDMNRSERESDRIDDIDEQDDSYREEKNYKGIKGPDHRRKKSQKYGTYDMPYTNKRYYKKEGYRTNNQYKMFKKNTKMARSSYGNQYMRYQGGRSYNNQWYNYDNYDNHENWHGVNKWNPEYKKKSYQNYKKGLGKQDYNKGNKNYYKGDAGKDLNRDDKKDFNKYQKYNYPQQDNYIKKEIDKDMDMIQLEDKEEEDKNEHETRLFADDDFQTSPYDMFPHFKEPSSEGFSLFQPFSDNFADFK